MSLTPDQVARLPEQERGTVVMLQGLAAQRNAPLMVIRCFQQHAHASAAPRLGVPSAQKRHFPASLPGGWIVCQRRPAAPLQAFVYRRRDAPRRALCCLPRDAYAFPVAVRAALSVLIVCAPPCVRPSSSSSRCSELWSVVALVFAHSAGGFGWGRRRCRRWSLGARSLPSRWGIGASQAHALCCR